MACKQQERLPTFLSSCQGPYQAPKQAVTRAAEESQSTETAIEL